MVEQDKSGHGGRRKGAGRPKSGRNDIAVKIDRTLAARARFVAELRGVSLTEYLSEAVRPVVDKDFARAAQGTAEGESSGSQQ